MNDKTYFQRMATIGDKPDSLNQRLEKLASHIQDMDSASGDAALLFEAAARITLLEDAQKRGNALWSAETEAMQKQIKELSRVEISKNVANSILSNAGPSEKQVIGVISKGQYIPKCSLPINRKPKRESGEERIKKAIKLLSDMIDGGEECRGMDSQISDVIRALEK